MNFDKDGVRAFSISGSGFDAFYPAYTSKNAASTEVTFIVKKSAATNPDKVVVKYHKEAANNYTRGDFEASAANIDALQQQYQCRENNLLITLLLLLATMVFVTIATFKLSTAMTILNERMIHIEQANVMQQKQQEDIFKNLQIPNWFLINLIKK